MCDHATSPQPVGYELHQKKQPERLNSNASVSSLSEAASDMSLSTSPGSDLPLQQPKDLTSEPALPTAEASSPQAHQSFPRKKPLVRKKSSNPYLVSSEMGSPCEDHPHIMGSLSYAAGESRLYEKRGDNDEKSFPMYYNHSSSPRANSYPLTSDCVDESEEDIDEDEDDSSNDEKQNGLSSLDNHLENKSGCQNGTASPGCQNGIENSQHQSYIETFRPGISPPAVSSIQEFFHDENHRHNQQHHNNNHHNQFHLQQPKLYRNSNIYSRRYSSESVNSFGNNISGFRCNANENEIYSRRGKPNSYMGTYNELQHGSVFSVSAPPKSREINSWGHFHKPSESYYKYRRSHYSSDSDGDDTSANSKTQPKEISSRLPVCESQLSHCPAQSACARQSNAQPTQTKSSAEKQEWTRDGVKPHEFKERFLLMKKWFSECNDGQKNIVMKGLLSLCELPQLHLLSVHMSKELHQGCPSNCEDIITWLPNDLAIKVLSYLDPVSLCHAAQVCRVWRQLAEDQSLWCRFCCQTKWRLSKAAEHKQVISHMCPEGSIQWKNVFAERFRLRNNWLKGRCTVRTFEGHLQGISCVQFDDSRIVSGSSDKTIKVWNMRTNAPWSVQTLMGHHGTVRCLHLEGNRLVSGSCDKTIKVWDLSTQESWSSIACKVTMTGHMDTVRCLQADDDKVISGSYDKTLKIWDLKTGELRRTLRGHQASVLCVHFSETKIVSGSADKTIKVWNYEGNCMMTLRGHQDAVTCLMFDSTRIVSGSLDHNLKFWDIHTGECLNTIDWKKAEGHTDVVRCLQADSWRVVSAADDKTIKVWNLATGERLVTLRNHTDGVTCLQFNDFIIVSGSYDKSVKLWDFSCC